MCVTDDVIHCPFFTKNEIKNEPGIQIHIQKHSIHENLFKNMFYLMEAICFGQTLQILLQ